MKRRNFKDSEYYCISNPLVKNENSGLFCVSWKFIQKWDKDFLFEWINPKTNEKETKVLSKEYVKNHLKFMPRYMEDKTLRRKVQTGYFFVISYSDIINY